MLAKVGEHVDYRIAHLTRRTKSAPVPTICPESSATQQELVHRACHANAQTPHSCGQRAPTLRLDNQMQVIMLDRKMDDAKGRRLPPIRSADCILQRRKHELAPKWREPRAHGHQHRLPRAMRRRARCGVEPRAPTRFRPAPRRAPPRRVPSRACGSGSASCSPLRTNGRTPRAVTQGSCDATPEHSAPESPRCRDPSQSISNSVCWNDKLILRSNSSTRSYPHPTCPLGKNQSHDARLGPRARR
jgi:hypothetical protein